MKAERVVLDTNVLISAVLSPHGKPFACLSWVLDNATLLASRELLDELETRLARPKFDRYLDDQRRRAFVAELALSSLLVELRGAIRVCRDPDDDKLLETAIAGGADCLVTGDQDLLVFNPFHGVPILTPAQFLEAVEPTRSG
jgi:putative PIN family toxin of toxin-antitoxin system